MVTRKEASLEQVEGVALALRQHANLGEAQRRPRSLGHSLELALLVGCLRLQVHFGSLGRLLRRRDPPLPELVGLKLRGGRRRF